jgi:hypothetical protein
LLQDKAGSQFEPQEYRDILRIQTGFPTPASREICHLWMDTTSLVLGNPNDTPANRER